jgi:hypothetical protein
MLGTIESDDIRVQSADFEQVIPQVMFILAGC